MESIYLIFQKFISEKCIQIENSYLNKVFQKFELHLFIKDHHHTVSSQIQKNINIPIIFISEYIDTKRNFAFCSDFFIICFENTVFIVEQTEINQLYQFFSQNKATIIYITSENSKIFIENALELQLQFQNLDKEPFFKYEILSLSRNFVLKKRKEIIKKMNQIENLFTIVVEAISGFLLQKSYNKSKNFDRVSHYDDYLQKNKENIISNDKIIELRVLSDECVNRVNLIYHIEREELMVLKMFIEQNNAKNLFERECNNYKKISYPFFPKYIGTTEIFSIKCIIIEYIQGYSLDNIHQMNISDNNKIKIIFQIMIAFQYLHLNNFIYRDLKPNNIVINEKGYVYIIDFDRMIFNNQIYQFTKEFAHNFIAPEILSGSSFTNKCDIYSIGKIIEFIFSNNFSEKYSKLEDLYKKCIERDVNKRPNISELIDRFYIDIYSKISIVDETDTIQNTLNIHSSKFFDLWFFISAGDHFTAVYKLANLHFSDIFKVKNYKIIIKYYTISADQNNPKAQYMLGLFYKKGIYVSIDTNKAIYYFTLAANQNYLDAQVYLGMIYLSEKNIEKAIYYYTLAANQNDTNSQYILGSIYNQLNKPKNINKAIYYYTIAANQNHQSAQCSLGLIYNDKSNIQYDTNKAIYYFTLAAGQNNSDAQYFLGLIYSSGKHIPIEKDKAIHYFTLSANQNSADAQYSLGILYFNNQKTQDDVNKAIYYLTLAANQNNSNAQNALGIIYETNQFNHLDIKNSFHYYMNAANQNHPELQFKVGLFYLTNKYLPRDINKSIHYFTLAANQNHSKAQNFLGSIYISDEYIPKDVNKAIHYFTLAANQNESYAQSCLGSIYSSGKYIKKDIDKAIYYLKLAANQNDSNCQHILGCIYANDEHVPRDIDKAIYYLKLSADQNNKYSQFFLGTIYVTRLYNKYDINKAIYYFTLALNQNDSNSQYALGTLYSSKEYVSYDINKSIHYFTLAANQNHSESQYVLGCYYLSHTDIQSDVSKGIQYLLLSSRNYNSLALKQIGILYLEGIHLPLNIPKSIHYFTLSVKYGDYLSNYYLGFIYCKGICVNRDIDKAIKYYKETSSFNHQYSKNNLGILLKNFKRNLVSIEYFEEAIRQKNDIVSMYNLGYIYFYGDFIQRDIDKSIKLFMKSSQIGYYPSKVLLSLAIAKKIDSVNINVIAKEMEKYGNTSMELNHDICEIIQTKNLMNDLCYKSFFTLLEDKEFIYDNKYKPVLLSDFMNEKKDDEVLEQEIKPSLSESFYEGFRFDIL